MATQTSGFFSPFLQRRRLAAVPRELLAGRVLDVGCGTGELAALVDPERYLGIDPDAETLEVARQRFPEHRFEPLAQLPADERFDAIVALAVIEHIDDQATWLTQMLNLLTEDGRIVITTPSPAFRKAHELGAALGLFSKEAAEEHTDFVDRAAMDRLTAATGARLVRARKFLGGANQLFIVARNA